MTFVGKILVILIMVLSIFFLAASAFVFTTEKNWKEAAEAQKKKVGELTRDINAVKQELTQREQEVKVAQEEHKKQVAVLNSEINRLKDENQRAATEVSDTRKLIETAQENVKAAQASTKAREDETKVLRETLASVQDQANKLKLEQTDLNQEIRELKRENEVAQSNNRDLRSRLTAALSELRRVGATSDIRTLMARQRSTTPERDVDGVVKEVDATGRHLVISLGKDDGLVVGHELEVYHLKPFPEYIGKIRVDSTDVDHSVGTVIGKTSHGIKIKEGDLVSSKIRPRG
jgi:septal ring factor EnvC (AmiA/AmiB activator)